MSGLAGPMRPDLARRWQRCIAFQKYIIPGEDSLVFTTVSQYLSVHLASHPSIMMICPFVAALLLHVVSALCIVSPPSKPRSLEPRLGGRDIVAVYGTHDFCMLMPK